MDYTTQVLLTFILSGVAYFFLYRFVFFKKLKWKMLHSIWIPLLVSAFFTTFGVILLNSPTNGGGFADLAGVVVLILFQYPDGHLLHLVYPSIIFWIKKQSFQPKVPMPKGLFFGLFFVHFPRKEFVSMDSVILTDLGLVLLGIVYFLVYTFVIAKAPETETDPFDLDPADL